MGSIPNGSAPLQACARQIFKFTLPGRTGKAQVRLAAAGRLRSAVALELAAGKVWALPIAVQSARGTRRRNGTGHSEWVRCHGLRAGAASHHACGREELLRRWADSETRLQGAWRSEYPLLAQDGEAGPRAGLSRPGQPRRQSDGSRSTVSAVP
jgi:hypothetical protein